MNIEEIVKEIATAGELHNLQNLQTKIKVGMCMLIIYLYPNAWEDQRLLLQYI